MISETESGLAIINKNYTEADQVTKLWITAGKAGEIGVRTVIESPPIPTTDCENTTSLVLVFYESQSVAKAAPKDLPSISP